MGRKSQSSDPVDRRVAGVAVIQAEVVFMATPPGSACEDVSLLEAVRIGGSPPEAHREDDAFMAEW
jgi:hypothetical protein